MPRALSLFDLEIPHVPPTSKPSAPAAGGPALPALIPGSNAPTPGKWRDGDLASARCARFIPMHPLKAKVINGRYVIEERANLPEGTELYLVPADGDDPQLSAEERAEVERMIEEGIEDYENGAYEDARNLGERLLARS